MVVTASSAMADPEGIASLVRIDAQTQRTVPAPRTSTLRTCDELANKKIGGRNGAQVLVVDRSPGRVALKLSKFVRLQVVTSWTTFRKSLSAELIPTAPSGGAVPGGRGNHGGLECLETLARVCRIRRRVPEAFQLRVMVEHLPHRPARTRRMSRPVRGIAMRTPEPVAGGEQPVAVARDTRSGRRASTLPARKRNPASRWPSSQHGAQNGISADRPQSPVGLE
jgi:hypothetical protein